MENGELIMENGELIMDNEKWRIKPFNFSTSQLLNLSTSQPFNLSTLQHIIIKKETPWLILK